MNNEQQVAKGVRGMLPIEKAKIELQNGAMIDLYNALLKEPND